MLQVKIKDDTGNTIGQNIRRIRKSRNIGQTALVRDLQLLDIDMTREALVKIERGIQHIQLSQLKDHCICRFTDRYRIQHIQLSQLKGIRDVLQTTYDELLEIH